MILIYSTTGWTKVDLRDLKKKHKKKNTKTCESVKRSAEHENMKTWKHVNQKKGNAELFCN